MPNAKPQSPATLFDLSGRVALITGASSGLGWSMAQHLAAAGAHVILNARTPATLEANRAKLQAWGYAASIAPFDVADPEASTEAIAQIGAKHGRLDILLSNAGGTVRKPLLEQTEADWQTVLSAHLTAGWRLAREAARLMRPARYGRIIFTGSVNGTIARPGITAYVAAKTGLEGLTRTLAAELAPDNITVNTIAPGYFAVEGNRAFRENTPGFAERINARTPANRWGTPTDLATTVLYLASPASAYTNGTVLTVDGGMSAVI
jgi:gluconate 5-dehydrogenase